MDWLSLSDDELEQRLCQHGLDYDVAVKVVELRDDERTHPLINQVLEDEDA